jgi:hypothetical protein
MGRCIALKNVEDELNTVKDFIDHVLKSRVVGKKVRINGVLHSTVTNEGRHHTGHVKKENRQAVMSIARKLLLENKFEVADEEPTATNSMIEYHLYHSEVDGEYTPSDFEAHEDNYAVINCQTSTCLFYFQNTFESGACLELVDESGKVTETFACQAEVVLMDGDVLHQVSAAYGKGIRECIIVQMKAR